jgi:5-methylcytosine-specific restriction endonuclease McrA
MRKRGVDVSHFQPEVKWSREVLQAAVSASTNMCEVLRRLGLDVVGGHHTHISRRVEAYGIDTSHFRIPTRRGKPRSPHTPESLLVEQPLDRARRIPGDRLKRAMAARGVPERCSLCGTDASWRGRPLPLEVDHIDGDWRDNRIGNLRLLCPNCHSVTDDYRGRGKRRPDNGRQRSLFRQWIAEDQLAVEHFLGQAHQRGKARPHLTKGPEDILVKHDGRRRTRSVLLRRALHSSGVPERCHDCGIGPEWLGKPMTLEVDHITGDWSDDRRENLRLLCPNCHAVTSTWCRGGRRRVG